MVDVVIHADVVKSLTVRLAQKTNLLLMILEPSGELGPHKQFRKGGDAARRLKRHGHLQNPHGSESDNSMVTGRSISTERHSCCRESCCYRLEKSIL